MKVGTKVTFTRRTGETVLGRVHTEARSTPKGEWLAVNIGDKKNEKIIQVRPSQVGRAPR